MSQLRSGRFRGYRVRKASSGPLVEIQTTCGLCGLTFRDAHVSVFWIITGRWWSKLGTCPECGYVAGFTEGYLPKEAAA